ncbi:hypothetical protein HFN89_06320 [Rhizobium laguerreae]|nr:hypothetical protein [Rhizobium laguerreae]
MQSLRYTTMAETVIRSLAATYPQLEDPERRWELSQAIASRYVPTRGDGENRAELRQAAEQFLTASKSIEQPAATSENGAEVYAFNIIWMEHGAVFATETHYVSFPDRRDTEQVEKYLAETGKCGIDGTVNKESVTWVSIVNNVPFEVLSDAISIRFIGGNGGVMAETGTIRVSAMRQRFQLVSPVFAD